MHPRAVFARAVALAPDTAVEPAHLTTLQPLHRLAVLADRRRRTGAVADPGSCVRALRRVVLFVVAGVLVVSVAPGTGAPWHIASWWDDPVAYQKFAVWALLWELLGLGGGSTGHVALTHWLRAGSVRLPPWPGGVLATRGTRRSAVDVTLYAAVLVLAVTLLVTPARDGLPGPAVWTLVGALVVLGLRDKVPFLAARPDLYLPLLLVAAFAPVDTIAAAQLCLAGWWWGRAVAALNRSYPAVVALGAGARGRFAAAWWTGPAHAPAPSPLARVLAAVLPIAQLLLPAVLLTSSGGTATALAVIGIVAVQLLGAWAAPSGSSLPAEVFVVYSALAVFGAGASAPGLHSATLGILLAVVLGGRVLLGLVAPRTISPIASVRFHCGSEAAGMWLVRDDLAEPAALGGVSEEQLAGRALLPRTAALLGLVERAVDDPARYRVLDGVDVAAALLGWSFGDGRLAGTALLDHVRGEVDLAPGQLRLVTLAAQGVRGRLHYRITDAATGKIEQGTIRRDDALGHRPFDADAARLPVDVTFRVLPRVAAPVVTSSDAADPPARHARPDLVEPVRLGADGATDRHRPRPSRVSS